MLFCEYAGELSKQRLVRWWVSSEVRWEIRSCNVVVRGSSESVTVSRVRYAPLREMLARCVGRIWGCVWRCLKL